MYRLFALLVACTWAFSTIAENKEDSLNEKRKAMCTDRNTTVDLHGCNNGYFATMFIYNETTETCHELPETICTRDEDYGVFYNIFTCAHTCAGGKGPEYCLQGPYKPANGTCTSKEFMWSFDKSCEPNKGWFYNASSEECERYLTCSDPRKFPKGVNGFGWSTFCDKECGRFHINNINGSEDRSDTVNCTGQPPALCEPEEEEDGWTRYFYNVSAQQCQAYNACEYNWPKGLGAINYFVTNRSCELECGNYCAIHNHTEVAARDDLEDQYSAEIY